jgi:hypothetical protein
MDTVKEALAEALEYDPIADAEKQLGMTTQDSEMIVGALGLSLAMKHNARKAALLAATADTTYGMSVKAYTACLGSMGFVQVMNEGFEFEDKYDKRPRKEYYMVFYRKPGVILAFDTYSLGSEPHVNGGEFCYNVRPKDPGAEGRVKFYDIISSGSWHCCSDNGNGERHDWADNSLQWLWCGDHDCREAVRFHLERLEEVGTFVEPWVKCPWFRLNSHQDWEDAKRLSDNFREQGLITERLSDERKARLPSHIQAIFKDAVP